jgi:hypothetical protein
MPTVRSNRWAAVIERLFDQFPAEQRDFISGIAAPLLGANDDEFTPHPVSVIVQADEEGWVREGTVNLQDW